MRGFHTSITISKIGYKNDSSPLFEPLKQVGETSFDMFQNRHLNEQKNNDSERKYVPIIISTTNKIYIEFLEGQKYLFRFEIVSIF